MFIKDADKVIMWKFSVKGAKIKSRNFFSFFTSVYNIKSLNERPGIINNPKSIVVLIKFAFLMKIWLKMSLNALDTILLIGLVLHLAEDTINLALDGL